MGAASSKPDSYSVQLANAAKTSYSPGRLLTDCTVRPAVHFLFYPERALENSRLLTTLVGRDDGGWQHVQLLLQTQQSLLPAPLLRESLKGVLRTCLTFQSAILDLLSASADRDARGIGYTWISIFNHFNIPFDASHLKRIQQIVPVDDLDPPWTRTELQAFLNAVVKKTQKEVEDTANLALSQWIEVNRGPLAMRYAPLEADTIMLGSAWRSLVDDGWLDPYVWGVSLVNPSKEEIPSNFHYQIQGPLLANRALFRALQKLSARDAFVRDRWQGQRDELRILYHKNLVGLHHQRTVKEQELEKSVTSFFTSLNDRSSRGGHRLQVPLAMFFATDAVRDKIRKEKVSSQGPGETFRGRDALKDCYSFLSGVILFVLDGHAKFRVCSSDLPSLRSPFAWQPRTGVLPSRTTINVNEKLIAGFPYAWPGVFADSRTAAEGEFVKKDGKDVWQVNLSESQSLAPALPSESSSPVPPLLPSTPPPQSHTPHPRRFSAPAALSTAESKQLLSRHDRALGDDSQHEIAQPDLSDLNLEQLRRRGPLRGRIRQPSDDQQDLEEVELMSGIGVTSHAQALQHWLSPPPRHAQQPQPPLAAAKDFGPVDSQSQFELQVAMLLLTLDHEIAHDAVSRVGKIQQESAAAYNSSIGAPVASLAPASPTTTPGKLLAEGKLSGTVFSFIESGYAWECSILGGRPRNIVHNEELKSHQAPLIGKVEYLAIQPYPPHKFSDEVWVVSRHWIKEFTRLSNSEILDWAQFNVQLEEEVQEAVRFELPSSRVQVFRSSMEIEAETGASPRGTIPRGATIEGTGSAPRTPTTELSPRPARPAEGARRQIMFKQG